MVIMDHSRSLPPSTRERLRLMTNNDARNIQGEIIPGVGGKA